MATDYRRILDFLRETFASPGALPDRLHSRAAATPPRIPGGSSMTEEAIAERWELPGLTAPARAALLDPRAIEQREAYARNIENFIGMARLPIGLAGPLRVNGLHAQGDYYVPLATTEAALVALVRTRIAGRHGGGRVQRAGAQRERRPVARLRLRHAGRGRALRRLGRGIDGAVPGRGCRNDAPRTARQPAADRRGQPRLPRPRVHHRRRLRPEHGHDRDRGDLPLHRSALAGAREILVRRGQHVGGQEGHDPVVHVGPRQEGLRRGDDPPRHRRAPPPHDRRPHGRLLAHVGAWRRDERQHRRARALRERHRGPLHRLRAGRGVRRGGDRRRHPLRAAPGRRALRLGHAAEHDRGHRRRRDRPAERRRRASRSWAWRDPAAPAPSPRWRRRSPSPASSRSSGALAAGHFTRAHRRLARGAAE